MKTRILIICFLLSTFCFAQAATMYPVLTDNSARTFTGGGTNLALLNEANTFTGTNAFAKRILATKVYTLSEPTIGDSSGGLGFSGGSTFFAASSISHAAIYYNGIQASGTLGIGWASGAADSGGMDTSMHRVSAGIVGIDNGTSGTYRDAAMRSLYSTNVYATNIIVGGGAAVTGILSATATLNFDLTAVDVEDLNITVTGAALGDIVTVGVPAVSITATAQFTGWVSAADTVTIRARTSAAGENPASGTFRATVIKH